MKYEYFLAQYEAASPVTGASRWVVARRATAEDGTVVTHTITSPMKRPRAQREMEQLVEFQRVLGDEL